MSHFRKILLILLFTSLLLPTAGCMIEVLPEGIEEKIHQEIDNKQYDEALADLEKMEKFAAVVNMGWVYGERGYIFFAQGKYEAAIEELSKAIQIEPDGSGYRNRGFAYMKLGRYSEAEADYLASIELEPDNSRAYEEIAGFYFNTLKFDDALLDIQKAIELAPSEARLYLIKADIRVRMLDPDTDSIILDLKQALELQPNEEDKQEAIMRLKLFGVEP